MDIRVNEAERHALAYAKAGMRVLPLARGSKKPHSQLAPNGVNNATTDIAIIRGWFRAEPNINIGIATGRRCIVVDADSKDAVEALGDLPPTLTASTPRGKHFYFKGDTSIRNSVGKIGVGIDMRGEGGYVVAPPSILEDGSGYKWENKLQMAVLPDLIARERPVPPLVPDVPPAGITAEAVLEGGRNDAIAREAGRLAHRTLAAGFSVDEFRVLLQDYNEKTCKPPLDMSEVDDIARRMYEKEKANQPSMGKGRLLSWSEFQNLPEPEYLIEGWLVADSLAVIYGNPGAGKTFLALDMSVSISRGGPWCDSKVRKGPVVYVPAEGMRGITRRIRANALRNGGEANDLYLFNEAVQLSSAASVDHFIDSIETKGIRPGLIVLDTLARCAIGSDENSAKDTGQVIAGMDRIRRAFDACILVVHHSTKGDAKTLRGSSALLGAFDTALAIVENSDGQRILTIEKQKDAERGEALRFRLAAVPECQSAALVLTGTGREPTELAEDEELLLDALVELGTATFSTWRVKAKLEKGPFNRLRTKLVKKRRVYKESDGLYSPMPSQPLGLKVSGGTMRLI